MLIIRGTVDDVELTGTLYEPGERPPPFRGAPDEAAPYVWICDEFYEVQSGGQTQHIAGQDVNLAFEHPMPRGFEDREQAIEAATEHVRTQFARIGLDRSSVGVDVVEADDVGEAEGRGERAEGVERVGDGERTEGGEE